MKLFNFSFILMIVLLTMMTFPGPISAAGPYDQNQINIHGHSGGGGGGGAPPPSGGGGGGNPGHSGRGSRVSAGLSP